MHLSQYLALTVRQPYASLIASGRKTLELRSTAMLKPGQRVVIAAGSASSVDLVACKRLGINLAALPTSVTLCVVECVDVFQIDNRNLRRVLRDACVDKPTLMRFNLVCAHALRLIEHTPTLLVRGNFGLWPLRKSRHGRDAGLL